MVSYEKKDTKLRYKKFSDASDLERGIKRIVENLRITDYDIYRRFRRHLTF